MGRALCLDSAGAEAVFVSAPLSLPISFSRLSEISVAIFYASSLGEGAGVAGAAGCSACQS